MRQKFNVILWTYGDLSNCPEGAKVRDARDVLPESEIFLNRLGYLASVSDLFRYAVLSKIGGLYSDTDVYALKPAAELPTQKFLVTERFFDLNDRVKLNPNVIFSPSPERGDIVDLAFEYGLRLKKTASIRGEIGPELLTAICRINRSHGYQIRDPSFANPIDWWVCPEALVIPDLRFNIDSSHFLHLYTSMWRRKKVSKDMEFPEKSIMAIISEGKLGVS